MSTCARCLSLPARRDHAFCRPCAAGGSTRLCACGLALDLWGVCTDHCDARIVCGHGCGYCNGTEAAIRRLVRAMTAEAAADAHPA